MRECSSKKARHRRITDASVAARSFARHLNQTGVVVEDLYVYRCPECKLFHLTREKVFAGVANELIFRAPPEDLQRWAMSPVGVS